MELAGTNTGVYEGRKWGSDQKNRNKNQKTDLEFLKIIEYLSNSNIIIKRKKQPYG